MRALRQFALTALLPASSVQVRCALLKATFMEITRKTGNEGGPRAGGGS